MNSEESFGERLRRVREKSGLTQEDFAKRMFVGRTYLNGLETGRNPPNDRLVHQLDVLEKTGVNLVDYPIFREPGLRVDESTPPPGITTTPRKVPVISWARAGEATSYEEIPKDWQKTVFSECPDPYAFAIEIEGDSMEPNYRGGDVVIVMPSLKPRAHCLVVAKLKSDGVVFKVLSITAPYAKTKERVFRLASYNPLYSAVDYVEDDFHWIYPVHSVTRNLW
ncbi:MAG TPA: XRE family transcriptional regulator [Rariglobus sp.]|jgi:SOS-response transcriptional repressor LexA|nr:XRE family transcriptional regulator [Rariglobus sp.]